MKHSLFLIVSILFFSSLLTGMNFTVIPQELKVAIVQNMLSPFLASTYSKIPKVVPINTHAIPLRFSPDGKTLAIGCINNTVCLWNVYENKTKNIPVSSAAGRLDFSSCGTKVAIKLRSLPFNSIVLDRESDCIDDTYKAFYSQDSVINFSHDGVFFAVAMGDKLTVWDREKKEIYHAFDRKNNPGPCQSITFSDDSRYIAIGPCISTIFTVFDMRAKKIKLRIGQGEMLYTYQFFCQNNRLLLGTVSKAIKLWDIETGIEEHSFDHADDYLFEMTYNESISRLAACFTSGSIKVWDMLTRQLLYAFQGNNDICDPRVVAIDYDVSGMLLATGCCKEIKVWWLEDHIQKTWLKENLYQSSENKLDTFLMFAQASLIARAHTAAEKKEYLRIQLGSDDVVYYMLFPAFVRTWLHFHFNIELPTKEEVLGYKKLCTVNK